MKRTRLPVCVYVLRDAIFQLDSVNYEFEFFVSRLLRYDGYETVRSPEPKVWRRCVDHEIDVVAKKGDEIAIIECRAPLQGSYDDRSWCSHETMCEAWRYNCRSFYEVQEYPSMRLLHGIITNTKIFWAMHGDIAKLQERKAHGVEPIPKGQAWARLWGENTALIHWLLVKLTHEERERLIPKKYIQCPWFSRCQWFCPPKNVPDLRMRRIIRIRNLNWKLINSRVDKIYCCDCMSSKIPRDYQK